MKINLIFNFNIQKHIKFITNKNSSINYMGDDIKEYFIEYDLIETTGSQSIQVIGEGGNIIYLDIKKIENSADNINNPKQSQYQEALEYIYQGKLNKQKTKISLPNGGILDLTYENLSKERKSKIHHITRLVGLQSALKRKGIECEFPKHLRYLTTVFDKAILDLGFQGNVFELDFQLLKKYYPNELFYNNQLIRFNHSDNLIYRISFEKKEIETNRFELDTKRANLIRHIPKKNINPKFFRPRTIVQDIGHQIIKDEEVELSMIIGGSGSGKTVLAYSAAIELLLTPNSKYDSIILFKPNDIIGGTLREEGYLPGTAFEKAKPYLQSFIDAHRVLNYDNVHQGGTSFENFLADPYNDKDEFGKRTINKFFNCPLPQNRKVIEPAYLRFSRGRTFENKIILVDEAQNFSPFEIKQLIERVGINSKIIIIGDIEQIDNRKLNKEFNALSYLANILFNIHPQMFILKLDKNYRSQSAEILRDKKTPKL